jgi:hypothetical protein
MLKHPSSLDYQKPNLNSNIEGREKGISLALKTWRSVG